MILTHVLKVNKYKCLRIHSKNAWYLIEKRKVVRSTGRLVVANLLDAEMKRNLNDYLCNKCNQYIVFFYYKLIYLSV